MSMQRCCSGKDPASRLSCILGPQQQTKIKAAAASEVWHFVPKCCSSKALQSNRSIKGRFAFMLCSMHNHDSFAQQVFHDFSARSQCHAKSDLSLRKFPFSRLRPAQSGKFKVRLIISMMTLRFLARSNTSLSSESSAKRSCVSCIAFWLQLLLLLRLLLLLLLLLLLPLLLLRLLWELWCMHGDLWPL